MAVTPLLNALIEIDEPLAQLGVLRILAIDLDEDLLHLDGRLDRRHDIAREQRRRHGVGFARQIAQERVPQGRLVIAPFERGPRAAAVREALKGLLRLHPEQELDLPELVRLETARRLEPLAEAE